MTFLKLTLCILISITANSYAYAETPPTVPPESEAKASSTHVNTQADITAGQAASSICQGCHGADGNSYGPEWPNLARQNANYLAKQIHDFQSGARQDPTMSSMVVGLKETDIHNITAFFAAQTVKVNKVTQSNVGKKIYRGGNRYSHVPACAGCHGPNGAGNGPGAIPSLAGQKSAYVAKTLRDFKSSTRSNDRNQIMRDIAAKMSDPEIDAVALFLEGMGAEQLASAK
ncbi:MAG: cytochrome c4 [Ectothiorhodospiraceae bacterium]|nr:cytochrome c4 [Ectothiorhodospiraceae bacterium]